MRDADFVVRPRPQSARINLHDAGVPLRAGTSIPGSLLPSQGLVDPPKPKIPLLERGEVLQAHMAPIVMPNRSPRGRMPSFTPRQTAAPQPGGAYYLHASNRPQGPGSPRFGIRHPMLTPRGTGMHQMTPDASTAAAQSPSRPQRFLCAQRPVSAHASTASAAATSGAAAVTTASASAASGVLRGRPASAIHRAAPVLQPEVRPFSAREPATAARSDARGGEGM